MTKMPIPVLGNKGFCKIVIFKNVFDCRVFNFTPVNLYIASGYRVNVSP